MKLDPQSAIDKARQIMAEALYRKGAPLTESQLILQLFLWWGTATDQYASSQSLLHDWDTPKALYIYFSAAARISINEAAIRLN